MPQQEGRFPTGVPCNIPSSSTPGNTSPQLGGVMRASPRNPLKNLAHYRSAGWKKDLDHILRTFYCYNYTSDKEAEWKKLKTKFFEYLGQHQEEWRAIKEEKPLQYMPYMESHFQALTGIRLEGLSQFTGWIKPGSYYHVVVARKGQLHMCLHLAGTELPKGPQICPSQTRSVTQKEEETPQPVSICWAKRVAQLKGHAPTHLFPWRQVEWGMASPGWNRLRPAPMKNGGGADPQSVTGQHLGNGKVGLPILSRSRIAREGVRQYSSSTGMQVSSHQPVMMWLPREWPAITLVWSRAKQRASTTRYSA